MLLAGGAVSCFSRTQHCVTLSSTESEYVALADVTREIVFLRDLLEFLLPNRRRGPVTVFEDNDGAIKLAKNPICTSRTKDIGVRCHFVREKVDEKVIEVSHVSTARQSADGLTKNLPAEALVRHRKVFLNE